MGFNKFNKFSGKSKFGGGKKKQQDSTPIWAYFSGLDTLRNGDFKRSDVDFKMTMFINNDQIEEFMAQLNTIADSGGNVILRANRKFNDKTGKPTNFIFLAASDSDGGAKPKSKYRRDDADEEDEEEEAAPARIKPSIKDKLNKINSKRIEKVEIEEDDGYDSDDDDNGDDE